MKKILTTLLFIFSSLQINAHPHVFIDIGMELTNLESAKISWTFDPIESENKLYFFDDNGDGELNKKEIYNLYNEGFNNIKDVNYFITIESSGNLYPVKEIRDFDVKVNKDKRLTVFFNIDLPELGDDKKLSITHLDTSYFIAFSEPQNSNIKLNSNLFSAVFTDREKPFYYDPEAGRGEVIDTTKPQKGWLKTYPTKVYISSEPIFKSFGNYKIGLKERLIQIQRWIYVKLSESLINIKDRKSIGIISYLLLLAFIYGAVHAIGPGHRKIVISSYILSRDKISYLKAIGISLTSALIHSGTGILSILLLSIIFKKIKPIFLENITGSLEMVSYLGVFLLATVLIILKLRFKKSSESKDRPVALSLIILSSLIPCPGAITIMLFSLSLNMLGLGIVTVLSMSIGIGLTLSIISVITLKGKTLINGINGHKLTIISSILEWFGLIILLLFSILMSLSLF